MRTMILIHGRNLQTSEWEKIVWGNPRNGVLGQVPKGIILALREKAECIYWGTGASEKDGMHESEYTLHYAITHGRDLFEFEGSDVYEIDSILRSKSIVDLETKNTAEEVAKAMKVCKKRGIDRLILVSAPTHISRCLLEAEKLLVSGNYAGLEVYGTASDVSYEGYSPTDVLVIEPPHLPTQPAWQTFRYVRGILNLAKNEKVFEAFLGDLGKLLIKYQIPVDWNPRA